jgi:DNA primase
MAKTYIDTVKYLVYTNVDIGGLVEKPDVVGAIFGQTEGLLGDELDLRDLQKNGRIGRIEVDLRAREGRTVGVIKIPSSLDMVETCIVAAALETVDRIGPCEANIKVTKVEDTRNLKRKVLLDRAKGLLKNLLTTEIPESKEISELVRDEVKMAEITDYGYERLPSGPAIAKSNDIVIVEGRADVINLLKNDINNAIAIGGANVPKSIVELSRKKEVTVFLDGDRGGDIILNELVQGGVEIEFVARAPNGKEVEELTRKELIKAIRSRVPYAEVSVNRPKKYEDKKKGFKKKFEYKREERREPVFERKPEPILEKKEEEKPEKIVEPPKATPKEEPKQVEEKKEVKAAKPKPEPKNVEPARAELPKKVAQEKVEAPKGVQLDKKFLLSELEELNNSLKARFYDKTQKMIVEMKVRDVIKTLEEAKDTTTIVFDGIITQRLVDLAANKGVRMVAGVKIGNVNKKPEGIEIVTK